MASHSPTCLEALVGLAPDALPCFALPTVTAPETNDWITASSRSQSAGGGVYVSQLPGLMLQPAQGQAHAVDLWERLNKARTAAGQYVRANIQQAASYSFGAPRFSASGMLGKLGNGSVYQGLQGLTLRTVARSYGAYRVTGLGFASTSPTATATIQFDGLEVGTVTTNGQMQAVTPFVIPFDGEEHKLTATLPDGVLPLDTKLFCPPCSGSSPFGVSVGQSLLGVTSSTPSAGFLLQVNEVCAGAASDALCFATETNDELADALAQAVQSMSGYYFLFDLLSFAGYNRYTLLNDKQLVSLGERYQAHADKMIAWLAQPTGLGRLSNPCYTCAPNAYGPRIAKTH